MRGISAIAFSAAPGSDITQFLQLTTELTQRFVLATAV
jgi:hypothetical protein